MKLQYLKVNIIISDIYCSIQCFDEMVKFTYFSHTHYIVICTVAHKLTQMYTNTDTHTEKLELVSPKRTVCASIKGHLLLRLLRSAVLVGETLKM